MRLSRTAVLAPVPGREAVLLVQPLTGQAALLEKANAVALEALSQGGSLPKGLDEATLRQAGFLVSGDEDERAMAAEAYAEFLEETGKTPTQLIVVPTFGCNLRCTYCYQEPFDPEGKGLMSPETVAAFFAWVDRFHGDEHPRPYITLFGGEPLVDSAAHHDRLGRFLEGAKARGLSLAIVTNGFALERFVGELSGGPVKEVQVTLDGPEAVHDARRPHAGGQGTFANIVKGVDLLVAAGVPVNLRVVVDKDNLESLPALAEVALAHGWLELPGSKFKTQVGRNYELFGCAAAQKRESLFDRVELWARFVELAEANPVLRRFHRPRFHGIRHLAENGELPPANFDACPAAKKEWAFAPDGGLYGCTATVGNAAYRLGSYWPVAKKDEGAIAPWRERSVFTIEKCKSCAVAPVCGGGCGVLGARHAGRPDEPRAPDCRPVKELYGLGAKFYRLGE
ncbi:MAG: radical SAM protein [Myxococcaceae bacterium]